MSPKWRYFFPGYLWCLLNVLIGLGICLLGGAHGFAWRDGCLTARQKRLPGGALAQTWGWLILYKADDPRSESIDKHERVHVVQSFLLGPLFLLLYPAFFLGYWLHYKKDYWKAYYSMPFEAQAFRRQKTINGWGTW